MNMPNLESRSDVELIVLQNINEIQTISGHWNILQKNSNVDIDFYTHTIRSRDEIFCPFVLLFTNLKIPISMIVGRIENRSIQIKLGYKSIFKLNAKTLTILNNGIFGTQYNYIVKLFIEKIEQLMRNKIIDTVFFNHLPLESDFYTIISKKYNMLRMNPFPKTKFHWQILLPSSLDQYINSKSKHFRKKLKNQSRMMQKTFNGKIDIIKNSDKINLKDIMKEIDCIASKTYQGRLGVGFKNTTEINTRLNQFASNNQLLIRVLRIEDDPVAFIIGTIFEDTFYLDYIGYNEEFRQYSPGTYLLMVLIEVLIGMRIKILDFGLGEAFYKERFGNYSWKESNIYIYRKGIKGLLLNFTETLNIVINNFFNNFLSKIDMLNKIKRIWRQRLTAE